MYQSAGHSVDHDPLGEVHGVGDGEHHQPAVAPGGPVEQVVHHILLPGPQQVQLQYQQTSVATMIQLVSS